MVYIRDRVRHCVCVFERGSVPVQACEAVLLIHRQCDCRQPPSAVFRQLHWTGTHSGLCVCVCVHGVWDVFVWRGMFVSVHLYKEETKALGMCVFFFCSCCCLVAQRQNAFLLMLDKYLSWIWWWNCGILWPKGQRQSSWGHLLFYVLHTQQCHRALPEPSGQRQGIHTRRAP